MTVIFSAFIVNQIAGHYPVFFAIEKETKKVSFFKDILIENPIFLVD